MKTHNLYNILRFLLIFTLGFVIIAWNILGTVPQRRTAWDLAYESSELSPETRQEKQERLFHQIHHILLFNLFAVSVLTGLGLLPYAKRKAATVFSIEGQDT